jgi:hypothetical protein
MKFIDLVEDGQGGYWKVAISTKDGIYGTAIIPGLGCVTVYKEILKWPPHTSFAWKIMTSDSNSRIDKR